MVDDLSRWNRAGLSRFRYLNGNAATYLEQLRAQMQQRFPRWPSMQSTLKPDATERDWQAQLERQYHSDPNDLIWQINRTFARACHVLGEHLDSYANEASLGTAQEWDNLRKLVAMLDYQPSPPASAYTDLAIEAKQSGRIDAGLAVKHLPEDGPPVVFETLSAVDIDPALNRLRLADYNRSAVSVKGDVLTLEGRHDKLSRGTPLVLENEQTGESSAHRIEWVKTDQTLAQTDVGIAPPAKGRFRKGYTRVHVKPKERLPLIGPLQARPKLNHTLKMRNTDGLRAGELVVLSTPGSKPDFLRLTKVTSDAIHVHRQLGRVNLLGATLSRPVEIPLSREAPQVRNISNSSQKKYIVHAAGDWRWLIRQWVSHRKLTDIGAGTETRLPHLRVDKANYWPVGTEAAEAGDGPLREGYTTLTLGWDPKGDDEARDHPPWFEENPQYLLAVPQSPGPWAPDIPLAADQQRLPDTLQCAASKHARGGDFAVLMTQQVAAWARLKSVQSDQHHGAALEAEATAQAPAWQTRPWPGPLLFAADCVVDAHFTEQLRLAGWRENTEDFRSHIIRIPHPGHQKRLAPGDRVILSNGTDAVLREITMPPQTTDGVLSLTLNDGPPPNTTRGNLTLWGNIVRASHGQSQPEQALGSGDATKRHQRFEHRIDDVSFIPDATQRTGVRAAVDVTVDGLRWEQRASLNNAQPGDAAYTVELTEDGTLTFCFGDGHHGRRLPSGNNNLRIRYRQGVGPGGNLPAERITQLSKPHPYIAAVHQPMPAAGGADREAPGDLRRNAPASLLTLSRAVSIEDFARMANAHASVWQARAFHRSEGRRETVQVTVVPSEGGPLTPGLKDNLTRFLQQHALPGADIRIESYTAIAFGLTVTVRADLNALDPNTLRQRIEQALVERFSLRQRRLGQPLYRSEVYQAVEAVPGVINASCAIHLADEAPPDAVVRVWRVAETQCLHLAERRPDISITVEAHTP